MMSHLPTDTARASARRLFALGVFSFALIVALLRVGLFTEFAGVRFGADWAMLDFDSGAYYPVRALLAGENPYDRQRFLSLYPVSDGFPPYPPFTLLFHLPFALLPHAAAAAAYAIFTVGLMLLLSRMALQETQGYATTAGVFLVAGVLLLTRPGHWNLVLGQRAALLAVGCYIALYEARRRPWLSGFGLALATLKPTWGVPLAILMLVRGDRIAVAAGAVLIAVLNAPLLAVIIHRAGGVGPFLERLTAGYRQWQGVSDVSPATSAVRIDAATTFSRFLGHPLGDGLQVCLTVFVVAAAALGVHLLKNDRSVGSRELTIGIICTAVLLCGHHVGYDFLLLTAPALAVLFHGLPATGLGPRRGLRWLFLVLFAIPALNWAATASVLTALQPSPPLWLLIASLNGVVLIAALAAYLWLAARWSMASAKLDPHGATPTMRLVGSTRNRS